MLLFIIIFNAFFIPFMMLFVFQAGKRRRVAQALRIAEYRKSPASRILRLND